MVYKITWTPKAIESFIDNINYLSETWSDKEVKKFTAIVEKKLSILATQPGIGKSANVSDTNIRLTVLHKRINLVYRVNDAKRTIELLLFWNTYQNPAKLK